jgi:acetyltransferase-like isoleucine patch superfamily enzyme
MNKQYLFTALASWIPFDLGIACRQFLYRSLFAYLGNSVQILSGLEFQGIDKIRIGNCVTLRSGARIRRIGANSFISIGDHTNIDSGANIRTYRNAAVIIGDHCYVGPYTCISGGQVTIGNDCLIASHCSIYANNHIFANPHQKIRDQGSTNEGIIIEDDCWIGSGVRIVDGVTISKGSVIGAGAVVTKDIPPFSIAVGVPARVIKQRKHHQPVLSPHSAAREQMPA